MATANYQFIETRDMFIDYFKGSGYSKDLSYEEWNAAAEEDKAALLFITFYESITLAWYKAIIRNQMVQVNQDDGVSTVLQYLMKNVSKISKDANRYNSNYIYSVCYNCLLRLGTSRGTEAKRSSIEISNEYVDGDTVVDLFDLVPSTDVDIETQQTIEAFWDIIHRMGPKAEKVVNHLINPDDTYHKLSSKSYERATDRLADVSVSKAEYEEIVAELKIKLAPYKDFLFGC